MKTTTAIIILWLLPWGLLSTTLILAGAVAHGVILGVLSLVGVVFVLSMARAAKGN